MRLRIHAQLDYQFARTTDIMLQLEAAAIPEQTIESAHIDVSETAHFARVAAHNSIGERTWLRVEGQLTVDYQATVAINRLVADCRDLPQTPPHLLPGETVEYLIGSRYCQSDLFQNFADVEFGGLEGGARVIAIRDWIQQHFSYVPGASNSQTTAIETFVTRQGICRDYAHVLITLARASEIPARIASVYALGLDPPDFHAVAEVFLGGEWHLVDATGMAKEAAMAKIGVGRDAGDVAFLTAYGHTIMNAQSVEVTPA